MATFHLELVSPERLLFSGEVDQADVPGAEGDFGVLAGHAPFVAMLRPGILTLHAGGERRRIVVFGGFAEVSPQGLTVLADSAVAAEDLDAARLAQEIRNGEEDLADSKDDTARDNIRRKLDQLRAVQGALAQGSATAH